MVVGCSAAWYRRLTVDGGAPVLTMALYLVYQRRRNREHTHTCLTVRFETQKGAVYTRRRKYPLDVGRPKGKKYSIAVGEVLVVKNVENKFDIFSN